MSRYTSDAKSRVSKKAKAVRRELEGGKSAEHLKPLPKPERESPPDGNMPWWLT